MFWGKRNPGRCDRSQLFTEPETLSYTFYDVNYISFVVFLFMKTLPNKLFRFQALNANNLNALRARKLWFSSIDKFNDPFEFYCDPLAEVFPDELPLNQAEQQRWIDQICQNTGEQHRGKLEYIVQSATL